MLAFTRKVTQTSARVLEKESSPNSPREGLFHLKSLLETWYYVIIYVEMQGQNVTRRIAVSRARGFLV